jgi:DnaJ like chaperone protein
VAQVFDQAKQDPAGFEPYAKQIARLFRKDHPVLEELLEGCSTSPRPTGGIHEAEIVFLRNVANIFGLDENDFARIREAILGPDKADPYTILGTNRMASNERSSRPGASWCVTPTRIS